MLQLLELQSMQLNNWVILYLQRYQKRKSFEAGGEAAVVESVKAASDVYSPVAGEGTESNDAIVGDPSLVNQDPEGNGWFFKIKVSDINQINNLMNKTDYDKFVTENA